MKMSLVVDGLRSDVIAVGDLGDDAVAELAERIAAVLARSAPARILDVLSDAATEVSAELPEGSDVSIVTASADVEVSGPVGNADLGTSSGDVSTDDVAGEVSAKSASGNITLGSVGGELRVHTASGDLRCSAVAGRTTFSTASGDVEIGSAGDRVDVKTTSGNARLGELARGARITGVSGDVRVLAISEGTLRVRSVSGNVAVGVAPGVDLEVDVETMSGSVQSDIPLDKAPGDRRGGARVEISIRNVSGDVAIEHALEQVA